jgi:hypothetical protein
MAPRAIPAGDADARHGFGRLRPVRSDEARPCSIHRFAETIAFCHRQGSVVTRGEQIAAGVMTHMAKRVT